MDSIYLLFFMSGDYLVEGCILKVGKMALYQG